MVLLVSCVVPVWAAEITENTGTGETELNYGVDTTFSVVIPAEATFSGTDEITSEFDVEVDAPVIPYGSELKVKVNFDGKLKLEEHPEVKLGYEMYAKGEENTKLSSGDMVVVVPAGTTEKTTKTLQSKLLDKAIYSGNYIGSLTFQILVEDAITRYTAEEIEANDLLYGIGATKREYVVAKFNESYTEVTVTKNGDKSDGLMVNWSNFTTPFQNPFFPNRATLKSAVVCEGVENIGNYCFGVTSNMTTVSLPDTLKTIGVNSFRESGITSITIPENVTSIGNSAFRNCKSLTGDLIFPDSMEVIDHYAFQECTKLNGTIDIGNGTKFIGNMAFGVSGAGEMKYTTLLLGDSLEFIGWAAFQGAGLVNNVIELPSSLKVIGDFAFNHLASVGNTTIEIPASVQYLGGMERNTTTTSNITLDNYMDYDYLPTGSHIFYNFGTLGTFAEFTVEEGSTTFKAVDGVLYSKNGERLVNYPSNKMDTEYEIPEGTIYIDELAFSRPYLNGTLGIHKITIPDSYVIRKPDELFSSQINCQNSLANALYYFSGVEEVVVKSTNPNYMTIDGCLYSKDGKICWYIPAFKRTVNIQEGCTVLESCFQPPTSWLEGSKVFEYNIPASVTSIPIYGLDRYPNENTIAFLNKMVKQNYWDCTITIDSNNPSFEVDESGCIVAKTSE